MTVPTTLPTTTVVNNIISSCVGIKSQASSWITRISANSISADEVFGLVGQLKNGADNLSLLLTAPGLNAAANDHITNYSGNLTNDVTAVIAAMQAARDWILSVFPKDETSTWVLAYVLNADGSRTPRMFTPTDTAGLIPYLTAISDTIG